MRVMQIASGDLWAGAEVQIFNLASNLAQREDVEVLAVLMNHGELERRLRERGVSVEVLDESRLGSVALFRRLIALMREWRPDVVHTHRVKENILGGVAAFVNRVPSIRTMHGRPESEPGRWDLRRQAMRHIDYMVGRYLQQCVVAVSDDLGDEQKRRYGSSCVAVIYNGIELPSGSPADICSNHQDEGPATSIAAVARLVPVKRIDLIIKVADLLHARQPGRFNFTLYGDGPLLDVLAAEVKARGLKSVVNFAGFRADVTQKLGQHDVMLITSDHEGLPTNLLEAMSLGVPVIARSVGAIPKVLGNGEFGALVTETTDSDIVEKIASLLEQPGGLAEVREKARKRAREYSAENAAASYLSLYRALVEQKPLAGASAVR